MPRRYCYPQCRDPRFNECADCWHDGGNGAACAWCGYRPANESHSCSRFGEPVPPSETTERPEGRSSQATGGEDLSGFPHGRKPERVTDVGLGGRLEVGLNVLPNLTALAAELLGPRIGIDFDGERDANLHLEPPCTRNPDATEVTR